MARDQSARSLAHDGLLYVEVIERLAGEIASGELAGGTRLLGERELCKRLNVSRVTLRRALLELRERGLITSDTARGWFVAKRSVGEPNVLMSFTDMARERGLMPSSVVLTARVRPASIEESDDLRIAPGSDLFDLERIRKLDGLAVALERSRVPLKLVPQLPGADLRNGSLYAALAAAGAVPHSAQYTLQAVPATEDQARRLEVSEGVPLLMASAVTFDRAGRPIELSRSVFLGDRYKFRTTLFSARPEERDR